jgi:N4-gp56 family major capsid protein
MADLITKYTQEWKKDENGVILIPDEFLQKVAVREAALDTTYTQLGDRYTQPKHKGDKMVKRVDFPILHPENRIDNGINANAATFLKNVWYAYDASNVLTGNPEGYATQALANAAGVAANTKSGTGNVYYGTADYNSIVNGVPLLGEEGGNVNAVNSTSKYVSAKIRKRGIHRKWTVDAANKDNRPGLLMEYNRELAEAAKDLREAEAQSDLIAQSELNVMVPYGSTNAKATLNSQDELTYATLEAFELTLKKARVPLDTKVISGSTKVDTKTIDSAWYIYVPQEIVPTLRRMQDNGVNVFVPVAKYKDASKMNTLKNEVGSIGRFRFVEQFNAQRYAGGGAAVGTATGAGLADEFTAYETGDAYDVFPLLFVGSDSFATIGYEGASMAIKTAMPKADANNDPFGEKGSIAIKWWTGFLAFRPERIRQIICTIRK